MRIKQHNSWLPILSEIGKFLGRESSVKINKDGYAELYVTGYPLIRDLKKRLMGYNLPLLARKWDKIDLDFKTKYEKKAETYSKIEELLRQGIKQAKIAKMVGISEATVTKVKKLLQNE